MKNNFFSKSIKIILATFKLTGIYFFNFLKSIPLAFRNIVISIWDNRINIVAAIICGLYIILFTILEGSFFAVIKLFNSVPNLIMSTIIAISIIKGPLFGGGFGVFAGIIAITLGNSNNYFLSLIYCMLGYFAGLIMLEILKDSKITRLLFIVISSLISVIINLMEIAIFNQVFDLSFIIPKLLIPHFFLTLLCGILVNIIIHFSIKWTCVQQNNNYKQNILKTIKPSTKS